MADEAVPAPPAPSNASGKRTGELPWQLWAKMTELFGSRWLATYGDSPGPMWSEACEQLGEQRVHQGVRAMLSSGIEHPPSLPRFLEFCRPQVSDSQAEALAYRLIPSYERRTCSRAQLDAIARANLARARQLLGGAEPTQREQNVLVRYRGELESGEIVQQWIERLT